MKPAILILSVLSVLSITGCSMIRHAPNPPKVVAHVDLERYIGTWYEIARYPMRFEEGCYAVTATYSLRDDGKIDVLNQCRKNSFDGPLKKAHAKAWVIDPVTNARLKVQFFWPFSAPYWIIELDEDYQYAVVSEPYRKYLWILHRKPVMDEEIYEDILERLKERGFDLKKLIKTPQRP